MLLSSFLIAWFVHFLYFVLILFIILRYFLLMCLLLVGNDGGLKIGCCCCNLTDLLLVFILFQLILVIFILGMMLPSWVEIVVLVMEFCCWCWVWKLTSPLLEISHISSLWGNSVGLVYSLSRYASTVVDVVLMLLIWLY